MKSKIGLLLLAAALLAPAAVSAQTQLRVVYHPIRDNKLPLWVAQDRGFYKKHGLEVTQAAEPQKRGENAVKAVLNKEIEIAVAGFRDVVKPLAEHGKPDLVMIASLAWNPFVFIAHPDIKTPADLKGKKMWTAGIGHGPDVSTRLVLRHMGLDPDKDVQLMPCEACPAKLFGEPVSGHSIGVSWIFEGKGVASLSSRSTLKDLDKAGMKYTLLVDFIDAGIPITAADVIVRRDWLEANRETAKNFLRALSEATIYAKSNKQAAETILKKNVLADYATGMDTKFEDYVMGVLPLKPYPAAKGAELAILEKAPGHPFYQKVKASDLIDGTLLQEIEKEGLFGK
jgi:NitT/TauT family transport system substrate-binding protein